MMRSDEEFEQAHDVLEQYHKLVVAVGVTLLHDLTPAQIEYVLLKMGDEFRFWNVEEELKKKWEKK